MRATGTNWRALAIGSFSNAFNYYLRSQAVDGDDLEGTPGRVNIIRNLECVEFRKGGALRNVSFGALAPADFDLQQLNPNLSGAPIRISSEERVEVAGVSLMGNVRLDNSQNTGAYSGVNIDGVSTYELYGFSPYMITCDRATTLSVTFGTRDGATGSEAAGYNYDKTWSNVQLYDSDPVSPALAASTATSVGASAYWQDLGPAFTAIFETFAAFRGSAQDNWTQFGIAAGGSPGFDGLFGRYNTLAAPSTSVRVTGLKDDTTGVTITDFGPTTPTTIFRLAGAGTIPSADGSLTLPGEIGSYVVFSALNVRVRTIRKGMDVDDVRTAYTTVTL